MILASINSGLSSSESLSVFWIAVIAGFGALVVLIGVAMEVFWEKHWYKNISDFRFSESTRTWGGRLVVAGLVWEVGFGTLIAVNDAIENADNNPLNQPLVDISAVATIIVNETNFVETQDWKAFPWVTSLILEDKTNFSGTFHHGSSFEEFSILTADDLTRITDAERGIHQYVIHFKTTTLFSRITTNRARKLVKDVDNLQEISVSLNFIPTDREVTGGMVDLISNGKTVTPFEIIPKKGSANKGWVYFGLNLDATNLKSSKIEKNLKN